jgi:circadian clock protein KaiC
VAPGQFAHLVSQSVDRDGARVVIIDSLNGYMNAMPEGRFLTTQLHELLAYLGSRGVATFIVVAQSGMMGQNMVAPVDTTYLADTVVLMRFFEHDGMVKKAISVLKRRTGQHEQSIRQIWFAHDGIHLSEPLDGLRGVLTGVPEERDTSIVPGTACGDRGPGRQGRRRAGPAARADAARRAGHLRVAGSPRCVLRALSDAARVDR